MMRRFGLGVNPTRTISTDTEQVHQHRCSMPRKRDSARLVVVMKVHRHLLDLQAVQTRDEKTFEIEAEAAQRLSRTNDLRRARCEALEPGLSVQNAGQQDPLRQSVEDAAHKVPSVEIMEERRTHHVA